MARQEQEGWVPDKIPQFAEVNLRARVDNPPLSAEIQRLARGLELPSALICEQSIYAGVEISDSEKYQEAQLVEQPVNGLAHPTSLMEQTLDDTVIQETAEYKKGCLPVFILKGKLGNKLMEIANDNNTTVDVVIEKMLILGTKLVRSQFVERNRNYFIMKKNQLKKLTIDLREC